MAGPNNPNINVSWQATLVIVAAIAIPVALIPPFSGADRQVNQICELVIAVAVILGALGILSKFLQVKSAELRKKTLIKVGIGLGIMVTGLLLTLLSSAFSSSIGAGFFMAPTGVYLVGIVVIARALPSNA